MREIVQQVKMPRVKFIESLLKSAYCSVVAVDATTVTFGSLQATDYNELQAVITIPASAKPGLQTLTLSCSGLEMSVPSAFEVIGQGSHLTSRIGNAIRPAGHQRYDCSNRLCWVLLA